MISYVHNPTFDSAMPSPTPSQTLSPLTVASTADSDEIDQPSPLASDPPFLPNFLQSPTSEETSDLTSHSSFHHSDDPHPHFHQTDSTTLSSSSFLTSSLPSISTSSSIPEQALLSSTINTFSLTNSSSFSSLSSQPTPTWCNLHSSSLSATSASSPVSSSASTSSSSSSSSSLSISPLTPPPTPPISCTTQSCQTSFRDAVHRGDLLEIRRILEDRDGKINVNSFDSEGQSALHQVCLSGNLELVQLLVHYGADVGLANRDGWNPLHMAAFSGQADIVGYLASVPRRRRQQRYHRNNSNS